MNISPLFHNTEMYYCENLCQLWLFHPFHSISVDCIDYKSLSQAQKNTIIKHLLEIISFIHQNNIIHGNIKLSNIQLSDDLEKVYLTDNYISKECKRSNDVIFDSPEVIKGNEISYKSDIWSIGCVIFYLFNGFLPFANSESILQCIYEKPVNNEDICNIICDKIFTNNIIKRISLSELNTIIDSNYNNFNFGIKRNRKLIIDSNYYMSAFMNRIILPDFSALDLIANSIKIVIKIVNEYNEHSDNRMAFSVLFNLLMNSDDVNLLYNVRQVLPVHINDYTFDSLFILKSTIHNGLNFYQSKIGYKQIEYLERILSDKSVDLSLDKIEIIVFRSNYIGNYGVKVFSNNLMFFPNLNDIKLEDVGIDNHGLKYLSKNFSSIHNLKSLSLQNFKGLKKMNQYVSNITKLQHLYLANNELNSDKIQQYYDLLRPTLNQLNIYLDLITPTNYYVN